MTDQQPERPVPTSQAPEPTTSTADSTPGQGDDHPGLGDHATGDIVIDSALLDLRRAGAGDLDAMIDAGQRVHQTLQARLADLGGE